MPKQLLTNLLLLIILTSFTGCSGEETTEETIVTENPYSKSTDSLFGNLTNEQLYFQHLILEIPASMQLNLDSLCDFIDVNQPGGLRLINWNSDTTELLKNAVDTLDGLRPIFYADYFETVGTKSYAYWKSNDSLRNPFYSKFFEKSGHNFVDFSNEINYDAHHYFDTLMRRDNIIPIVASYSDINLKADYNGFLKNIASNEFGVKLNITTYDTVNFEAIKKSNAFTGFFFSVSSSKKTNNLLSNGIDFVFAGNDYNEGLKNWSENQKTPEFINSTKAILAFKEKLEEPVRANFEAEQKFLNLNYQSKVTALIKDEKKLIPFKNKFTIYSLEKLSIPQKVREESNCRTQIYKQSDLSKTIKSDGNKVIILGDSLSPENFTEIQKIKKDNDLIVCFQKIDQYEELKNLPHLIYVPKTDGFDPSILAQQIKGKLSINGNFVVDEEVIKGIQKDKSGLARVTPELVGMSADSLRHIDYAVKSAMNGRAFPGCQVLLAKNGNIIYDKSFGYHSYKRQKLVTPESMYDLASLTKVVATTMIGMKLYELNAYKLDDSLSVFLPDSLRFHLQYPSTIRNITFQELFIHKSGLPSGFPIINYMQYTSPTVGRYDKYYCDWEDTTFTIEIAENYYMDKAYGDSMWLRLNRIFLDPAKPYKYSDVSMNTLYYMFSSILGSKPRDFGFTENKKQLAELDLFEEYLYRNFYKPLGMNRSRYRPRRFFNKTGIVPTEDEKYWRKQLLQGSVHDPNAALMGGIGGNAGMFSTTNDLVKLMQMMLNKGIFEGKRYLNAETVTKFTSAQVGSHRGLGWNKPTLTSSGYGISDYATLQTFGHTGFTGTCIWVDPASEIVYIFLSNRVHPTVNNRIYQFGIRKSIHQTAYRSLIHEKYSRN